MSTKARKAKLVLERQRCREDAHYFIFDSKRLLTKDEHDADEPVKPLPDTPYLRVFLDCLLVSGRIQKPKEAKWALEYGVDPEYLDMSHEVAMTLVEKSRQVMATWTVCAYLLWRAKFRPYQLILVQSKREDDASNLVYNKEPTVGRISFMEVGLPQHLRSLEFPRNATFGQLYFPNGSRIWAIPEGGDVIRSNTPTVIFSDESAFQPEFGNSYAAARPSVEGGGQYVAVSSAEPGEYGELIEAI